MPVETLSEDKNPLKKFNAKVDRYRKDLAQMRGELYDLVIDYHYALNESLLKSVTDEQQFPALEDQLEKAKEEHTDHYAEIEDMIFNLRDELSDLSKQAGKIFALFPKPTAGSSLQS